MSKRKLTYEELLLKLKNKEAQYNRLFKKENKHKDFDFFTKESLDLICVAGTDSYFKEINAAFIKVLGYSKKELLQNSFLNFVHPDDIEKTFAEVKKIEQGSNSINFENRYLKKNGEYVDLQWKAKINLSNNLIYAIARDVTQIKKAQQKIELSEKSLNEAQKIAQTGSYEFDLITNELKWSNSLYDIFEIKKKPNQNLYDGYLSRFSSDDMKIVEEKIKQSIISKKPYEIEHPIFLSKNRIKWIYGTGIPILDDNGDVIGLRGIGQDITEKKEIANALKAKEIEHARVKE